MQEKIRQMIEKGLWKVYKPDHSVNMEEESEKLAEEIWKKIAKDIVKIILNSKATFFVGSDVVTNISAEEALAELKAEICTNVENYFYNYSGEKEGNDK